MARYSHSYSIEHNLKVFSHKIGWLTQYHSFEITPEQAEDILMEWRQYVEPHLKKRIKGNKES